MIVPSERLFSSTGDTADDKLTCLLAENLETPVFLKANLTWNCKLVSDVGLKTDFILSFNVVFVFSLLYIGNGWWLTRQNDDDYVNDDIAYNDYTDAKFNYSYSVRIRPNNSVNYSYLAE